MSNFKNNLILEKRLHKKGTNGVSIVFAIAKVPIIQPKVASVIEKSLSRIGNKGATIEYPIPLNIFIQNKSTNAFFIFIQYCNSNKNSSFYIL